MNKSTRIVLINKAINKLEKGIYVNRKLLNSAIGEVGLHEIYELFKKEKEYWSNKPQKIVEYSNRIRKGLIHYAIGDRQSLKGDFIKSKKSFEKAEYIFENSVEYLYDCICSDYSLRFWIDYDLTNCCEISYCPNGIPRPIWSNRKKFNSYKLTKKQITLNYLYEKIDQIEDNDSFKHSNIIVPSKKIMKKFDFSGFKF